MIGSNRRNQLGEIMAPERSARRGRSCSTRAAIATNPCQSGGLDSGRSSCSSGSTSMRQIAGIGFILRELSAQKLCQPMKRINSACSGPCLSPSGQNPSVGAPRQGAVTASAATKARGSWARGETGRSSQRERRSGKPPALDALRYDLEHDAVGRYGAAAPQARQARVLAVKALGERAALGPVGEKLRAPEHGHPPDVLAAPASLRHHANARVTAEVADLLGA